MAKRDYYEVLGLQKGASADEIKRAYRKLAVKWHPDKWSQASDAEKKTAEENFKELAEAYDVLSDDNKRARYDQFGHAGMNGAGFGGAGGAGGFGGAGFDPMDIFNAFFGGGGGFGGGNGRTRTYTYNMGGNPFGGGGFGGFEEAFRGAGFGGRTVKGQDLNITLKITLDDVLNGVEKKVKIRHTVADGQGGVKQIEEVIPIKLPKGVMEGQKFKATGKGNAAPGGQGQPGDLIVNIEEIPHGELMRDKEDLVYNLLLSFPTAALGGPAEIPTLNGRVRINVPAGTQPGKMLRLKGKGLPVVGGSGYGDLIVNILVYVPEKLNDKERKAIECLRDEENCSPNEEKRQSLFTKLKYFFSGEKK